MVRRHGRVRRKWSRRQWRITRVSTYCSSRARTARQAWLRLVPCVVKFLTWRAMWDIPIAYLVSYVWF